MNRHEFAAQVDILNTNGAGRNRAAVEVLMTALMKTRAQWASAAIVDMVYGAHGERAAAWANFVLVNGIRPVGISGGQPFSFAAEAFAEWCLNWGKLPVVKVIATRGINLKFLAGTSTSKDATTLIGRWVDLMSSVRDGDQRTFPQLLERCAEQRFFSRALLEQGAAFQVDIDLKHRGIRESRGTELGAMYVAAQMTQHIKQASTAPAPLLSAPSPSSRARRAGL